MFSTGLGEQGLGMRQFGGGGQGEGARGVACTEEITRD